MYVTANGVYADEATGKWGVKLQVWNRRQEYVVGDCESPPHFESAQAASEASSRAIRFARDTGKLPNMNKEF